MPSVLWATEIAGRRYSKGKDNERKYSRKWRIRVDDMDMSGNQIETYPGLPQRGDFYLIDPNQLDMAAVCEDVSIDQDDDDPYIFYLTADYSTKAIDPQRQQENPLQRPALFKWKFNKFQKPVTKDKDGKEIVNSADDPFEPPMEKSESTPVLVIEANKANFDIIYAMKFQDAINNQVFFGAEKYQAKVQDINADQQYENEQYYYKVSCEIELNKDTWLFKPADRGLNTKAFGGLFGQGKEAIRDAKDGQPITEPVFLNGTGQKLAAGGEIFYHEFHVYNEVDFAELELLI